MECADSNASMDSISRNRVSAVGTEKVVTVHALRKQQRILPMLRIPNRQNLLPPRYLTALSVPKVSAFER